MRSPRYASQGRDDWGSFELETVQITGTISTLNNLHLLVFFLA